MQRKIFPFNRQKQTLVLTFKTSSNGALFACNIKAFYNTTCDSLIRSKVKIGSIPVRMILTRLFTICDEKLRVEKINSLIVNDRYIDWELLWNKFDIALGLEYAQDLFSSYIPPHKYIGIKCLRKVFEYEWLSSLPAGLALTRKCNYCNMSFNLLVSPLQLIKK